MRIISELRDMFIFEWNCLKRAWQDTRAIPSITIFLYSLVIFISACWLDIRIRGWDAAMDEAATIIIWTMPVIIGMIVLFLLNLLLAPSRIFKEKESELALYQDAYEQPLITFQSKTAVLPSTVPESQVVWILHLHPQKLPDLGSIHFLDNKSIPDWSYLKNDSGYICECKIKNYGKLPLFNLSMPVQIEFRESISMPFSSQGGTITQSGDLRESFDWILRFSNVVLEPGEEFTFWLYNSCEYQVKVEFPDTINLQINDEAENRDISLKHTFIMKKSAHFLANTET